VAMNDEHYVDLFNADIAEVDSETDLIISFEEERQARRFVLIPSESIAPRAVRQALGSAFNNIYAEGYPPLRMTRDEEELVLNHAHQLAYYRRYADRRFYKGVEYADVIETLAQRRCARCFATKEFPAESIFVNVQPLSGAAANLAVYQTFLQPGDTLMGLNLFQGGHLTHGSEFNLSGRLYRVVSYDVDRSTERLDYDAIMALAREHRPKIIVAGYTSYPWAPDWARFREIADEAGALLMADIAHTAGMVVAGAYPRRGCVPRRARWASCQQVRSHGCSLQDRANEQVPSSAARHREKCPGFRRVAGQTRPQAGLWWHRHASAAGGSEGHQDENRFSAAW